MTDFVEISEILIMHQDVITCIMCISNKVDYLKKD